MLSFLVSETKSAFVFTDPNDGVEVRAAVLSQSLYAEAVEAMQKQPQLPLHQRWERYIGRTVGRGSDSRRETYLSNVLRHANVSL